MYGLGKAQGSDSCPLVWFSSKKDLFARLYSYYEDEMSEDAFKLSDEWNLWVTLYDLVEYLTKKGLEVNEFNVKLECGSIAELKTE